MSTQVNGTVELMGLDVEDQEIRTLSMDEDEAADPENALDEWSDHLFADIRVHTVHFIRWTDWDNGECVTLAHRTRS